MAEVAVFRREPLLERLRARAARHGLRATLAKAWADHVFRHSSSVILEYRREWGGRSAYPVVTAGRSYVTVRNPAELPPLCPWLQPRGRDFADMAAAGKVGLFVLHDGVAVGCAWLALSDHHDRRAHEFYAVAPGEAYHYCWLVAPDNRSRAAALPLIRYLMAVTAEMGIERQFGVIDRVNRPSYQIQIRFGYRECGRLVRHICILHTRWTLMSRYRGTLGLANERSRKAAA